MNGSFKFWIHPDFFNLFLVFFALFLWLYKHKKDEMPQNEEQKTKLVSFLLSDGSDYLASLVAGIAVFSKPPNIIIMGPIVLYALFKKKFVKAVNRSVEDTGHPGERLDSHLYSSAEASRLCQKDTFNGHEAQW